MSDHEPFEIRLTVSQSRRWIGVLSAAALGLFTIYVAFLGRAEAFLSVAILLAIGISFLYMAMVMHRVTLEELVLTEEGLFHHDGTPLARINDIEKVDRGLFAFRPSNGFLLRMNARAGIAWKPGLYWRIGRSIGVGGATSPSVAKAMADTMTQMIHKD